MGKALSPDVEDKTSPVEAYQKVKIKTPFLLKSLPFLSVAITITVWELLVALHIVPHELLATPIQVIKLFFYKLNHANPDGATIAVHAWTSISESFTAYILSFIVGVPLGLLMGWYVFVEGLVRPVFEFIRPIPPIAWIPLCIFWFGIGITGKIFIIWIAGIVPFVLNSMAGVKMTDPTLIQMARTYGATDWQIFKSLCVPSALPMIFSALQITLAYCWTNLVGAELLAANSGLGYLITMGRRLARPDMIVLGMITVGLTGAFIGVVVDLIERHLLSGWRR